MLTASSFSMFQLSVSGFFFFPFSNDQQELYHSSVLLVPGASNSGFSSVYCIFPVAFSFSPPDTEYHLPSPLHETTLPCMCVNVTSFPFASATLLNSRRKSDVLVYTCSQKMGEKK